MLSLIEGGYRELAVFAGRENKLPVWPTATSRVEGMFVKNAVKFRG